MVYITYPMYYTKNIYIWWSGLETCFHTDCLLSNCHTLKQKVYFILWRGLKTLSRVHYKSNYVPTNIFIWQSYLKTWFQRDCCHSNYQMHKQNVFFDSWPSLKMFCSVYYQSQAHSKYFVWQSGLKTLFPEDHWLQQYKLEVQVLYTWVKIFFVSWLGLNTFCNFYYQANQFDVQA